MQSTKEIKPEQQREYESIQDMQMATILLRRQMCLAMTVAFTNIARDNTKIKLWRTLYGKDWNMGELSRIVPSSPLPTIAMVRTLRMVDEFYAEKVVVKGIPASVTRKMILNTVRGAVNAYETHVSRIALMTQEESNGDI